MVPSYMQFMQFVPVNQHQPFFFGCWDPHIMSFVCPLQVRSKNRTFRRPGRIIGQLWTVGEFVTAARGHFLSHG